MTRQLLKATIAATVMLVLALSGCTSPPSKTPAGGVTPPATSGNLTSGATLPPSTGHGSNSTMEASSFVGAAAAHATRSLSWNTTGDALLRFTMTAPKTGTAFPQCDLVVEAAFQYVYDAQNAAFFVLASGGASFTYGAGESVHVGPVAPHGVDAGSLHAWRFELGPGDTWGTNVYTIGVLNMTWWPNDVVGDTTLRVTQTCDSPFEISNVTGSRTLNILTEASFHGGAGGGPVQPSTALMDTWQGAALGKKSAMVGFVAGYAPAVHLTATTSQGTFTWQSTYDDGNSLLFREIPTGNLGLSLDALSGHLGLVVGDLEPLAVPENLLPGGK